MCVCVGHEPWLRYLLDQRDRGKEGWRSNVFLIQLDHVCHPGWLIKWRVWGLCWFSYESTDTHTLTLTRPESTSESTFFSFDRIRSVPTARARTLFLFLAVCVCAAGETIVSNPFRVLRSVVRGPTYTQLLLSTIFRQKNNRNGSYREEMFFLKLAAKLPDLVNCHFLGELIRLRSFSLQRVRLRRVHSSLDGQIDEFRSQTMRASKMSPTQTGREWQFSIAFKCILIACELWTLIHFSI